MDEWEIKTGRLRLRPLMMQDKEAFFSYRSLEEVARYQSWRPGTLKEAEDFIRASLDAAPESVGSWLQLAICLPGDRVIGDIGIHFLGQAQLEIGYTLSPRHQGMGFASEAVSAVISYAFTRCRVHRITASADPANTPSIRLLRRLGFRQEAYFVKSYWTGSQWADDCVFALLQEEWRDPPG